MDHSLLKRTLWELCKELTAPDDPEGLGMKSSYPYYRDDIGITLIRIARYGLTNDECVSIRHADWHAVMERTWPDWDRGDDKDARMFGHVRFYISGDLLGPSRTLSWLRLSQ